MVNFGLLAAEIDPVVWGTPANFNGFRVLAVLLHGTAVLGIIQTAALNRGRHLYSAGRPSHWVLAHILIFVYVYFLLVISCNMVGEVDLVGLKPILWTTTSFSVLTLLVGSFDP